MTEEVTGYVWDQEAGDSAAILAIKARLRWAYDHNDDEHGYPWNKGASAYLDAIKAVRESEHE